MSFIGLNMFFFNIVVNHNEASLNNSGNQNIAINVPLPESSTKLKNKNNPKNIITTTISESKSNKNKIGLSY